MRRGALHLCTALLLFFCHRVQGQAATAEERYAMSEPAVVQLEAVFSANVFVNKVEINKKRFQLLIDSIQRLDESAGAIPSEDKLDIVVRKLSENPERFFSATSQYYRRRHTIVATGTGFFITGDGYFITNCHVIDRDSSFIRRKFILSAFQEVTDANISALEASWQMKLDNEQKDLLNKAYGHVYSQLSSMILFNLSKEIFVQMRKNNEPGPEVVEKIPARVVVKGKSMPGKDVAILKVDKLQNLPTLMLSRSLPGIGQSVDVLGFPEAVSENAYLLRNANFKPTLTSGVVSAIKQSLNGWPVIQMDAVIAYGSSGSPVYNRMGEVVGIATFGSLEQQSGTLATGFNFAIPVSVIWEFVHSAGIKPTMSKASIAFNNGIRFIFKKNYGRALNNFTSVKKMNAGYPSLGAWIKKAEGEKGEGGAGEYFIVFLITGILVLMLLALRYRRKS